MLVRLSLLARPFGALAAFALVLATTACSSLTRPDEITIVAEPLPAAAPTVRQLPPLPAPGRANAVVQQVQPQRPAAGSACGD